MKKSKQAMILTGLTVLLIQQAYGMQNAIRRVKAAFWHAPKSTLIQSRSYTPSKNTEIVVYPMPNQATNEQAKANTEQEIEQYPKVTIVYDAKRTFIDGSSGNIIGEFKFEIVHYDHFHANGDFKRRTKIYNTEQTLYEKPRWWHRACNFLGLTIDIKKRTYGTTTTRKPGEPY